MSTTQFNSLDDFLNHNPTEGGGGKFMKGWKKKGYLEFWLSRRRLPIAVWQHSFPRWWVKEDKESGKIEKKWMMLPFVCHEDEAVLSKQYFRDRDTGDREVPPQICPIDLFVEWIRYMVETDAMSWTEPVFEFAGSTDPRDDRLFYAAGLYNGFKDVAWEDLSKDEKADFNAKKINIKEAYKLSVMPKLNYVLTIVDQNNVRDGLVVTTETGDVGKKIRTTINDSIASLRTPQRPGGGNPMVEPYCFQVTYDEKARINDKYTVRRIEKYQLTPEIDRMISGEPPDISQSLAPFDVASMRAVMEKHCLLKGKQTPPWDKIFHAAELAEKERKQEQEQREEQQEAQGEKEPEAERAESRGRRRMPTQPPPPQPDVEMGDPCEKCGAPMAADATKCEGCGTTYEMDPDDEPAPAPSADEPKAKPAASKKRGLPF